jgi:hypothetical protein
MLRSTLNSFETKQNIRKKSHTPQITIQFIMSFQICLDWDNVPPKLWKNCQYTSKAWPKQNVIKQKYPYKLKRKKNHPLWPNYSQGHGVIQPPPPAISMCSYVVKVNRHAKINKSKKKMGWVQLQEIMKGRCWHLCAPQSLTFFTRR